MQENPYAVAINRYFLIVLGAVGGLVWLGISVRCILSGHAPEFGRRSLGPGYYVSTDPSQFWFTVVFFAAFGLAFLYLAWRAYRS